MSRILVTGAAGFIGFHLSEKLLQAGHTVLGLDNINDYYDVRLKDSRLSILKQHPGFQFEQFGLEDTISLEKLFKTFAPEIVVNLAAQAGVRYSIQNPQAYINSNLVGFSNILECCRHNNVQHLLYASSSSVYGANTKIPFATSDNVDHPMSLYAATKKANELMAHSYANLYNLPCTGLRFFTVYGPWGRPDMALFIFTKAIMDGKPIDVFNNGEMERDFTYIDDIVEGIVRLIPKPPVKNEAWDGNKPDPSSSFAPYKVYNIGNNQPVKLLDMIALLEKHLGRKAEKRFLPMQPGDVPATCANVDDLMRDVGFSPSTPLDSGIQNFVRWYKDFYQLT